MKTEYILKKGSYYVGDPASIVLKNDEGESFLQQLWDIFYKSPNEFQNLKIKGIKFLVTRTAGGDGVFNGIGTDTGVIIILNMKYLRHKKVLRQNIVARNIKILDYDHNTNVAVENFNIYFEDFKVMTV